MTRIVVILAFLLAACDVGSVATNNQGGPDGSTGGTDSSGSNGSNGSNCDPVQSANLSDGHHNAGQSCLQAGCHLIGNAGAGAPEYSYGGTLYRDATGASAFPGATIEVVVGGMTYKMVAQQNGNFYLPKALGNPPTAATTGQTLASGCPSANHPMSGALVDNGGNCNNCHRTGGTTSPIYLQ
jgi:hypothetical protein